MYAGFDAFLVSKFLVYVIDPAAVALGSNGPWGLPPLTGVCDICSSLECCMASLRPFADIPLLDKTPVLFGPFY